MLLAAALSALPQPKSWPLPNGLGGILGDLFMTGALFIGVLPAAAASFVAGLLFLIAGTSLLLFACGTNTSSLIALWAPRSTLPSEWANASLGAARHAASHAGATIKRGFWWRKAGDGAEEEPELEIAAPVEDAEPDPDGRIEPTFDLEPYEYDDEDEEEDDEGDDVTEPNYRITRTAEKKKHTGPRVQRSDTPYEAPPLKLLQPQPRSNKRTAISDEVLQENARELEGVLQDFGVKGEITNVRPGPVVTLYELEPAPGTKSSRVIGLADDIARSMSAVAARVAVVPGRNAIGIELPNDRREIVVLRELLEFAGLPGNRRAAGACARQEYRRRVGHRRPLPHAASPDRRHHRLRQVGRHQHHDPVAALPALARPVQIHHDRPEDAGALRL